MKHVDEHTLELYVLGSAEVAARRGEIERHLVECHGCRALAASMESFYAEADRALDEGGAGRDTAANALVRAERSLRPLYEEIGRVEPYPRAITSLGRLQIFVRRHPVAAGSGALAALALVVMGLFTIRPWFAGPSPRYAIPNSQTGRLEIYDRGDSLLWWIPSKEIALSATQGSEPFLSRRYALVDLDEDGRREVITTLALREEARGESLRVFNANGTPRWSIGFSRPIPHRFREYTERRFTAGTVVAIPAGEAEEASIFYVTGITASPSLIVHVDGKSRIRGTYWHHGQFQITGDDTDGDGHEEIIAYGIDDSNEGKGTEFPFLAVLDPVRLTGDGQSSATPFYRLPFSPAEQYYIALPLTDIHHAVKRNAWADLFVRENDTLFSINAISADQLPSFRYWFNGRMEVLQAKIGNPTEDLHAQLRNEGRVRSTMGPAYLEEIRRMVRYWDGSAWREKPTRVAHPGGHAAGLTR